MSDEAALETDSRRVSRRVLGPLLSVRFQERILAFSQLADLRLVDGLGIDQRVAEPVPARRTLGIPEPRELALHGNELAARIARRLQRIRLDEARPVIVELRVDLGKQVGTHARCSRMAFSAASGDSIQNM